MSVNFEDTVLVICAGVIIRVTTSVVEAFPAALCSSRSMGYDIVDCT